MFSNLSKIRSFKTSKLKIICLEMLLDFLDVLLGVLVSPKINFNGFGKKGHVRKPRNHRNEGVEGYQKKTNRKVINSN